MKGPISQFKGPYSKRFSPIWTKRGENYSYKPPGASYTAPRPYILQGNKKMRERYFYNSFKHKSRILPYITFGGPIYSLIGPFSQCSNMIMDSSGAVFGRVKKQPGDRAGRSVGIARTLLKGYIVTKKEYKGIQW